MPTIDSTPEIYLPDSKPTSRTTLYHLTDLLAHPDDKIQAWLVSLGSRASGVERSRDKIVEIIRRAAIAGVADGATFAIVTAIVRADGRGWSPHSVDRLISSVYWQVRQDQEEGIRARHDLSPSPRTEPGATPDVVTE